ncbi:MAG TPA: hypothetical protein VF592_07875 [Sphingomonas sp.]|jgi:hypothetical protein|uniref:hypothetical protein n=1 Tax=Sphingomonas sp. TaxID=28214 RepID=UPI002EDB9EC7
MLHSNLAAADLAFGADELALLDELTAEVPNFTTGVTMVPDGPIVNALSAKPGDTPDSKARPVA